jgi:hypothetical protein
VHRTNIFILDRGRTQLHAGDALFPRGYFEGDSGYSEGDPKPSVDLVNSGENYLTTPSDIPPTATTPRRRQPYHQPPPLTTG